MTSAALTRTNPVSPSLITQASFGRLCALHRHPVLQFRHYVAYLPATRNSPCLSSADLRPSTVRRTVASRTAARCVAVRSAAVLATAVCGLVADASAFERPAGGRRSGGGRFGNAD